LNNPVRNTDPTGHCVWDACVVEGAALVAIATAAVWVGFQVWNTIDPPDGHQLPPSNAPASDTGGQLADPQPPRQNKPDEGEDKPHEVRTRSRIEDQFDVQLRRVDRREAGDWMDQNGRVWDGVTASIRQNDAQFVNAVKNHFMKDVDYVAIDLTDIAHTDPSRALAIRDTILRLSPDWVQRAGEIKWLGVPMP
jgi:hypothetical protein